MNIPRSTAFCTLLVAAGCMSSSPPAAEPSASGTDAQLVSDPVVPLECSPARREDGSIRMPVAGRASPYDSANIRVGNQTIRVCYGRPGVKGRQIFGSTLVPYDTLWRTGANEPTILHVPFTADIAGIRVPPGSYSLYSVPRQGDWTIIINRSTSQWGHEGSYTPEVRAQEVGRAQVPSERLDQAVELFTIREQPVGNGTNILLEWERTRVRIPVRIATPG